LHLTTDAAWHAVLNRTVNAPEEFLTLGLVEFSADIVLCALNLWDDHVLDRVHTSVGCLDDLVKRSERRLERGKNNQNLQALGPLLLTRLSPTNQGVAFRHV
jgi:hypothetical protein